MSQIEKQPTEYGVSWPIACALFTTVLAALAPACSTPEQGARAPDTVGAADLSARSTAAAPATEQPQPPIATAAAASASATSVASGEVAPLPSGMKLLIIGDSFAEALGAGLRSRESSSGPKVFLRGEKATFIPEWAGPKRGLAGMVVSLKPDLVVIALGGNELAMTTPEIRAPKVKELVALIGATPCVWVSPPLWGNKDNGLLRVIHDNSSPCRYYDSTLLAPDLPRGSDKIHPTVEGQRKWADHFLSWLQQQQEKAAPFSLKPRPAAE